MICSTILLNISGKLQDLVEPRRWQWEKTDPNSPSLIDYLNVAITQIVGYRPDATAKTEPLSLVKGFKQTLPITDRLLLNILYSIKGDEFIPVTQATLHSLMYLPQASSDEVDSYAYNKEDDPKTFWVYPHVDIDGQQVMATVSKVAPIIVSASDEFPLDEKYISPAIHYVLSEIYSGDNEDFDMARAQSHYEKFLSELGVLKKTSKEYPVKPKEGNQ